MASIKPFQYHHEISAFTCTNEWEEINGLLGLNDWTPVVWLTRLCILDNDYGEHVFDNWDEREALWEEKGDVAKSLGIKDEGELMIVVPERFRDHDPACYSCDDPIQRFRKLPCPKCGNDVNVGADGPCHSDDVRERFWTDVFKSLAIDLETMFAVAIEENERNKKRQFTEHYVIKDLEQRIEQIKQRYNKA